MTDDLPAAANSSERHARSVARGARCSCSTASSPSRCDTHPRRSCPAAGDDIDARACRSTRCGSCSPTTSATAAALPSASQLVLLDLLVERRRRDAELLGGLGLVAAALLERLRDRVALDALE